MRRILAVALAGMLFTAAAQAQQPNAEKDRIMAFFQQLQQAGEWRGTGKWNGGGEFVQVHRYAAGVDGRIVKTQTSIPDSSGTGLTLRAEGIRAWDAEGGQMRFWEFDRAGGITTGRVGVDGESIFYEYPYTVSGRTITLRDTWRPRQDGSWDFRIASWANGAVGQVFLEARFVAAAAR